jgi:hypothetical protein
MSKEKTEAKKVDLKTQQIELPKIDVTKYIGKKSKIVSADTYAGEFGYYVKIETEIVETLGTKDKKIELKGSKIFGLQMDEKGNQGWGAETKLGLFLKKMNCISLKQLVGKEVILQVQTSKDGVDFLSFN